MNAGAVRGDEDGDEEGLVVAAVDVVVQQAPQQQQQASLAAILAVAAQEQQHNPPLPPQQQQQASQAVLVQPALIHQGQEQHYDPPPRQEPQQQQQQQQPQPPQAQPRQEAGQPQEQQPALEDNNEHHQAIGSSNNNDNSDDVNRQRMLSMLQAAVRPTQRPPPPPTINDPNMRLTGEEEEFALQIKEIIEMEPGLEPLSDYWYAHLALVNRDNIHAAVQQAHGLQAFCQEYDIIETVAMGRRCVEQFLDEQPGLVVYMENSPGEVPVLATDYSKVRGGGISSYKSLRGFYYLRHATCADFAAIRHGMSCMSECEGFDALNFGWRDVKECYDKLGLWYPLNLNRIRLFHTGVLINCIFSMSRRFMSTEDWKKIEFGVSSPMGNIANIYLLPTPEAAMERLVERTVSGLARRYANEAAFTLEY